MSERPVADLDDVGDDSSNSASNDATDGSEQQGGPRSESSGPVSGGGDASRKDEDLMPDLADNPEGGATESNPN